MSKKLFICLLIMSTIASVVGLSSDICARKKEKVFYLTFGSMNSTAPLSERATIGWEKWIERESGGRIKITHYASETLAKAPDLYDAVESGICDMAAQYSHFLSGRIPVNEVTSLPGIFEWPGSMPASLTHMELYDKYPEIQAEYSDVKVLYFYYGAPTQIQTVTKPVRTMEDLKGMIMLEIGPWAQRAMKLLGGTPESLPPVENYDALVKGLADGISVNWAGADAFGYMDVIKYSTEVSFTQPGILITVMNLNTWNKLPPDLQKLFTGKNAYLASKVISYSIDKDDKSVREDFNKRSLKAGLPEVYVLPAKEKARWLAVCDPLKEEWVKMVSKRIGEEKARAILKDCFYIAEKYRYNGNDPESENTLQEWLKLAGYAK
jgi:TRAP-type C4-dicarboxylate transport system substrate-binding protein